MTLTRCGGTGVFRSISLRLYSEFVASRRARRMIQRPPAARGPAGGGADPALLLAVADFRHVRRVEAPDDHHGRLAQEPRERDREERVPGGEPAEDEVGTEHAAHDLHGVRPAARLIEVLDLVALGEDVPV